jgi:hypothetical protein
MVGMHPSLHEPEYVVVGGRVEISEPGLAFRLPGMWLRGVWCSARMAHTLYMSFGGTSVSGDVVTPRHRRRDAPARYPRSDEVAALAPQV